MSAPSLYHHFTDKNDILVAAAHALLVDIPGPSVPAPEHWAEWFTQICIETYRHVLRTPRAAKLLVEHFPRSRIFPAHDRASGLIIADANEIMASREESADATADRWPAYRAALNANRWSSEEMFVETVRLFLAGVAARYL